LFILLVWLSAQIFGFYVDALDSWPLLGGGARAEEGWNSGRFLYCSGSFMDEDLSMASWRGFLVMILFPMVSSLANHSLMRDSYAHLLSISDERVVICWRFTKRDGIRVDMLTELPHVQESKTETTKNGGWQMSNSWSLEVYLLLLSSVLLFTNGLWCSNCVCRARWGVCLSVFTR
jgi:hypothetical protein